SKLVFTTMNGKCKEHPRFTDTGRRGCWLATVCTSTMDIGESRPAAAGYSRRCCHLLANDLFCQPDAETVGNAVQYARRCTFAEALRAAQNLDRKHGVRVPRWSARRGRSARIRCGWR